MADSCIVYLYKASGLKDGEVAVDFTDQSELDKFTEIFHPGKRNLEGNTWLKLRGVCYNVVTAGITGVFDNQERQGRLDALQEGYYTLNLSALKSAGAKSQRVYSSLRFAYSIKVPAGVQALLPEITTKLPTFVSPDWPTLDIPVTDDFDQLVVHNVGNSNFHELRKDDVVRVVYDHGCTCIGKLAPKHIAKKAQKHYSSQTQKPLLVISHWDMDHVNMLSRYSASKLKDSFCAVVFPNLFFSEFSKRQYNRLVASGIGRYPVTVYSFKHTPRVKLIGSKTSLLNKFVMYCGVTDKDKCTTNYCCIGIIATGNNGRKAVLPGDQFYSEVISYVNSCDFFVVPHHGSFHSLDGTKNIKMIPLVRCKAILSSAGKRYGLPDPQIIKLFTSKGVCCDYTKGKALPIIELI